MSARGPLSHIRVVDFTWIIAGPQATRVLAQFGAEVIRIEWTEALDSIRNTPPFVDREPGPNRSGFFNNMNNSKLSVTLNVHHPDAAAELRRLIAVSDIVIENYSSRVLEEWGLGYEEPRRIRPDIVYLSLSGFGHSGPLRDYGTWGPTAQALSGMTAMSGLPGHPPAGWGYSYMDHTAGYYGAMALLLAIHHRTRTGQGQHIDLSQIEAGLALTGPAVLDFTVNGRPYAREGNPPGNRSPHPAVAPHNTYACQGQDRWCAIAAMDEKQWKGLVAALGDPDWAQDPRFSTMLARVKHQDDLDAHITVWTATRSPEEVMAALQSRGVPAGVVQTSEDRAEHDPQLRHYRFLREVDHAEMGRRRVEGPPVHLTRTPGDAFAAAPLVGEHNDYVYAQLLGIDAGRIAQLAAEAGI